jgi:8-amino-7-oxononanoate synthase
VLRSLSDQLAIELRVLDSQGRLRTCPHLAGSSRVESTLDDRRLISFSSNDYLGLATHPDLILAASQSARLTGFGAGASRLVSGDLPEHRLLEHALASLVRLPSALLFPTGYQANLGVVASLAGPSDLIVADRAIHASLIDGCRLSGAKLALFPHLQLHKADHHLARLGPKARRRLLITESLFSMDGDVAPLPQLAELAKTHDAALIVDEAHAIGVLGPQGGGLCLQLGVSPDVLIGTLGKALGASGAFAAGSPVLRQYLVNRARTFIFTTALPPAVAAAALKAVEIVRSPQGDELRSRLASNIATLRASLSIPPGRYPVPIIPLILGPDQAAVTASLELRAQGIFVQPIRPPTVREGTARLRLTVSAAHTSAHLSLLARALSTIPQPAISSAPRSPILPHLGAHEPNATADSPIPGLFVAGTDTAVGKTAVASALLHLLAQRGLRPVPFKPVETDASPYPKDAHILLAAAQRPDLDPRIVCPLPLALPVAPAAAADAEGVQITLQLLLERFATARRHGQAIVVESAGGLLSPYTSDLTSADLAAAYRLPVLLVARNSLGAINHTALAIAEIRRRGLPFLGTILVDLLPGQTPDQASNADLITSLTGARPLGNLPYLKTPTPALLAHQLADAIDLRPIWSLFST